MNKVVLIGRLTKDPELQFVAGSGLAIAKFSLAVNRIKKGEVDFINCVSFGKTAENITQYFSKGKQMAIVGRIQNGSFDDKEGKKRYTTDIVIENFDFIGDKSSGSAATTQNNQGGFDEMTPVDDGDMPF